LTEEEKEYNGFFRGGARQVLVYALVHAHLWLQGGLGDSVPGDKVKEVLCSDSISAALDGEASAKWTLAEAVSFVRGLSVVPLEKGAWQNHQRIRVFSHYVDVWRFRRWFDSVVAAGVVTAPRVCNRIGFLNESSWEGVRYLCNGPWMTRQVDVCDDKWPQTLKLADEKQNRGGGLSFLHVESDSE
jgi:hypothetical protein